MNGFAGWHQRRADYDVVVVGARLAGAATAMLLARAGLSVLAVDRARYGTDTLSTHALTRAGVLQLSRWGLLGALRAAGTPRVEKVVYHYGDEPVEIPVRPRGDVDGLYAPRRALLDRLLVDAAVAAGAEIRHRVAVTDLHRDGSRVTGVRLAGGETVRARLVVGADGARSTIAQLVGAAMRYTATASTATIYTFADQLPADAYRNWFRPGVGAGLIPTNAGQANLWIGVPMAELRQAGHRDRAGLFHRALRRVAPRLAAAVAGQVSGPWATFPGRPGFVRQWWGPGWALVGDAAYFKDPISAHGMTDALIGAEELARAVTAIAAGADEPTALAGYARRRERLIRPMIPAIERLSSFAWDLAGLKQAHTEINQAMRAEWEHVLSFDVPAIGSPATGSLDQASASTRSSSLAASPPASVATATARGTSRSSSSAAVTAATPVGVRPGRPAAV